jgi:hypothetical protein
MLARPWRAFLSVVVLALIGALAAMPAASADHLSPSDPTLRLPQSDITFMPYVSKRSGNRLTITVGVTTVAIQVPVRLRLLAVWGWWGSMGRRRCRGGGGPGIG